MVKKSKIKKKKKKKKKEKKKKRRKKKISAEEKDYIAGNSPSIIFLLFGKGHETEQVVGRERRAFDDRSVAARLLGSPT